MMILRALLLCILPYYLRNLSHAKENFDIYELAKARDEFGWCGTTTAAPTFGVVWKVTATPTSTALPHPGNKEHGLIMDAVHHTMMDYEYRYMWLSLMRQNYTLFMDELKAKGPSVFIRPKFKKGDDTFKGTLGERRWKFLLQYLALLSYSDFTRLIDLFDYERLKYDQITEKTYSSPPLPDGYWRMTDPNFWKNFTEPDNTTFIDPWKYTIHPDLIPDLHKIDPKLFNQFNPNV